MSDLEEILISLYASAISVSISWIWHGDIDVKLGDAVNGLRPDWDGAGATGSASRIDLPATETGIDKPLAPIETGVSLLHRTAVSAGSGSTDLR